MKSVIKIFGVLMCVVLASGQAWAYNVPQDSSRAKYFYVFGPDGDVKSGAEDHEMTLFIDVSSEVKSDLSIWIYDPNTGGKRDQSPGMDNDWDTVTEFEVHGKELLDKEAFDDEGYDKAYYQFGPYAIEKGEKIGSSYRFTLKVKATQGNDANLFKVKISPDSAEAFSENITFRLLSNEGDEMYFYPEIPKGTKKVILESYDLDANGGVAELFDPVKKNRYSINGSGSGEWSQTNVLVNTSEPTRFLYKVTKATQKYANAGLRLKDENGNAIPIYFRKGKPQVEAYAAPKPMKKEKKKPELSCNRFVFDATSSYDADNQDLSFKWNFGDGQFSEDPVVTHVYEKGGDYKVILTVQDTSGMQCDTSVVSQGVRANTPPEAVFSGPELSCIGQSVTFRADATRDDQPAKLSYNWAFGDGTTAEGPQVTKVFEKGGLYKVTLNVDDGEESLCSTDSKEGIISINTPPVASAGEDMDLCLSYFEDYNVKFDASDSLDKDGDRLDYQWDFGDGSSDKGEKVSHVYQKSGIYTARLTVNDGSSSCGIAADQLTVKLNKNPVADAGKDVSTCVGRDVNFDSSASLVEEGKSLSYTWDFGDGATGSGMKPSHAYKEGGLYTAVLIVDDGQEGACSDDTDNVSVLVNSRPKAALDDVTTACVGSKVAFNSSNSNDPDGDQLRYSWDFGDGTVGVEGSKASHTYENGGQYLVKVTADDRRGTACSVDSTTTLVKINTPPVADAGPNLVCCVGAENVFDASFSSDADGDKLTYMWEFGDGATGEGVKTKHVYKKSGEYDVTLTVKDDSGVICDVAIDTFKTIVNEKPVPIIKIR